jgi:selenophosphate synthetase-related protein
VLAAPPYRVDAAVEAFTRRRLTCAACGAFDDSRVLRIANAGATAVVWDLAKERLTGLGRG